MSRGRTSGAAAILSATLLTTAVFFSACGAATVGGAAAAREPVAAPRGRVEARDGRLFVDGKPFFVRGVGYEAGGNPGSLPWTRGFDPALLEADFRRIREAGFNVLRSWAPFTDSELALADSFGLMAIQGLYVPQEDFLRAPALDRASISRIEADVRRSERVGNVLLYLVMNEPAPELLVEVGVETAVARLTALRDAVKRASDGRALVSFSSWPQIDFLPDTLWDVTCFNLYPYGPPVVSDLTGFDGYVDLLVRRSGDRPVLITEHGIPVPPRYARERGITEAALREEQREKDLAMCATLEAAGAAGSCAFIWSDGWWKNADRPGDERTHDPDDPEEWFGFVAVVAETDPAGTPRPVLAALAERNAAILLEPRPRAACRDRTPVRVALAWKARTVEARLADGAWTPLEPVWEGEWAGALPGVEATTRVEVRVRFSDGTEILRAAAARPDAAPAPSLSAARVGEAIRFRIEGAPPGETVAVFLQDFGARAQARRDPSADSAGVAEILVETRRGGVFGMTATLGGGDLRTAARAAVAAPAPAVGPEALARRAGRTVEGFDLRTDSAAAAAFPVVYRSEGCRYDLRGAPGEGGGALRLDIAGPPGAGRSAWGYAERRLARPVDLSGDRSLSIRVRGEPRGARLKVMLIDADGERWIPGPVPISPGWSTVALPLDGWVGRDPYDGVTNGDGRCDLAAIAGIAVVVAEAGAATGWIEVDDLRARP